MHIVHSCIISPKYLRCWQTDYGTDSRTGELLYEAQAQSFIDKDKGIRLSLVVSDLLRKAATESDEFPSMGPDTRLANYEEALFMMGRSTCTVSDIERFRNPSADSATCGLGSTDDNLGERLSSSDIDVFRQMSSPARELHRKLESSVITSPLGLKIGQMNTRGLQNMYADLNKCCDNAKTSLLSDFN